jgi:two-component system NtrC family response regulator
MRAAMIAQAEEEYLRSLMAAIEGDMKEACRISGLSRSRLYVLLNKYKINPP